MATLEKPLTLKHRANLGEETTDVSFAEGDEVVVLKEWEDSLLCKSDAGLLFNIPKDCVAR